MKNNKKRLTLKVTKLNNKQLSTAKGGHGSDFNAEKNRNNGEGPPPENNNNNGN